MKRVYTADSVAMAWHVKNVLESNDIDATVRNEGLMTLAGEVPFVECLPEVWVLNDLNYLLAEKLIKEIEDTPAFEGADWHCRNCQESNLANYAICWNCQSSIDEDEDEDEGERDKGGAGGRK
ncbi:MAG: hypothetical protein ACJA2D_001050 [Pseudohongiellaceae bacterium]|jgi:hypothetical protein